jgi:hypothetical protein
VEFDAEAFNEVVEGIRNVAHGILNDVWPVMPPAMDHFLDQLFFPLPVPGWVRDTCQKVLKWCYDAFVDFVDHIITVMEGALVPVTASLRALAWNSEHQMLDTLQLDVSDAVKDVAITWKGPGASAFQQHAAQHTDRLTAMTELAKELRTQTVVTALCAAGFYFSIAKIAADSSAAAAVSAASTAVDGPAGPAAAGASAAGGVAGFIALVAAVGTLVSPMVAAFADLSDKASAMERDWPAPGTVDFNDGSASDGDATDWSTER